MGNADDLTATAALLQKIDDVLIAGYAKRSGKSDAQISAWMKSETWFTAQEAVTEGFADSVSAAPEKKAQAKASAFNLSAFINAPQALTEEEPEIDDSVRDRMMARLNLYERTAA